MTLTPDDQRFLRSWSLGYVGTAEALLADNQLKTSRRGTGYWCDCGPRGVIEYAASIEADR